MGKRELLLVGAFVIVGVLMYQLTAAPPPPGSNRVSARGVLDHIRRELRGNRSNAEATSTTTHPVTAAAGELRLRLGQTANVTVVGEARDDIEIQLKVWSNGYDDAEAVRLAKQSVDALKVDDAGAALIATVTYPDPGQQRPTASVKVPSRLRVRIEQASTITATNLSALELGPTRGDATISDVSGLVTGTHRGGKLSLARVGMVKLNTRGSEVMIADARELTLTINGGSLEAGGIAGAIEIDSTQADLKLLRLETTKGPVRINAAGETVLLDGLQTEARIDGRNSVIHAILRQPSMVAIYNEAGEIRLTPPASGGYKIDALARNGTISPPDVMQQLGIEHVMATDTKEARATATVRGGGPMITLRATRGAIVFRKREDAKPDEIEKK